MPLKLATSSSLSSTTACAPKPSCVQWPVKNTFTHFDATTSEYESPRLRSAPETVDMYDIFSNEDQVETSTQTDYQCHQDVAVQVNITPKRPRRARCNGRASQTHETFASAVEDHLTALFDDEEDTFASEIIAFKKREVDAFKWHPKPQLQIGLEIAQLIVAVKLLPASDECLSIRNGLHGHLERLFAERAALTD